MATLALVALAVLLGVYALPRVYRLGGAIRATLYANYVTIEAAQHMGKALYGLQLAEHDGRAAEMVAQSRDTFARWMDVEKHNFTETGEPELAARIDSEASKLFDEIGKSDRSARHDPEFEKLAADLDELTEMNRAAMFRADSRATKLGTRLTYEFALGLLGLLILGGAVSWGLGSTLSRPLSELADRLRGVSQRKTHLRLGPQRFEELDIVAREFNQMAEKLEQYEKLNVERLVYEKKKIEAIIESLEDGVVLIDRGGVVTHINEIATLILGIESSEALGSSFDDLSTNSPHYLRVRDALRVLRRGGSEASRIEVQLHVRGRDHTYVLKPMPLHQGENEAFGTLLILQDVTYLRDQDRARTNLVATLSHELKSPLTSLALSAELMRREEPSLSPKMVELLHAILEECARMTQLTDNLLNLAKGQVPSITVNRERVDLGEIAGEVAQRFAIQAREKNVALEARIEKVPTTRGDSVKLSWVVSNLLGNALRYTPENGKIEIATHPQNGGIRLEVADSGPGIAPELRGYIFERFAQYGNGGEKGSAGLGLAIVKDIVEAHGGRIFVEANNGVGSRFIVDLPVDV